MNTYYCDASTYKNGQIGQDSRILVLCPGDEIFKKHLGNCTINTAELEAIYTACDTCLEGDKIITDSLLSFRWITKTFKKTKDNIHLESLVYSIKKLVEIKKIILEWVPRDYNLAGKLIEDGA